MNNSKEIIGVMREQGLLPLYFHHDKETSVNILRALYAAGVRVVEYTNRGAAALENFAYMKKITDAELPGLKLGAGTIKTKQHALDFISAGADFIISPGLNEEVCATGNQHNIFWIPGCMTPSEIMAAERHGALMVKLFPGSLLGPEFLSSIKELFPEILFIPTGGVKLEQQNLTAWFKSGVVAVGAGSTLISKSAVESGDFDALQQAAKNALALITTVMTSPTKERSI